MKFKYLQHHAHLMTRLAVSHGDLTVAERCGFCMRIDKLEAHHPDYSKPLEVIWLCRSCHASTHETVEFNANRHPFGKRKRIKELAREIAANGDVSLTTAEMKSKYGISNGSTAKVRELIRKGLS